MSPGAPIRMARAKLALHVRRRRQNPEQILHKAVADYLRVALVPPAWFTTFPAGGGGKARGGQLKAMGLMPGMPDLLVFWPGAFASQRFTCMLGIELKAARGTTSPAQRAMSGTFQQVHSAIAFCKSIDHVASALAFWSVPHRARVGGAT